MPLLHVIDFNFHIGFRLSIGDLEGQLQDQRCSTAVDVEFVDPRSHLMSFVLQCISPSAPAEARRWMNLFFAGRKFGGNFTKFSGFLQRKSYKKPSS